MGDAFKKGFGWMMGLFVGSVAIGTITNLVKEVQKKDAESTEDSKKDEEEA